MENLHLTISLLSTSSKLEKASSSLRCLTTCDEMRDSDREILAWAGEFLSVMDWGSNVAQAQQPGGGLAVQATAFRPTFYSCLFRIAQQMKDAGFSSEEDVTRFLTTLYHNLLSSGAPGRGNKKLTEIQIELGATLLHEMAESILIQINNNGLPKSGASLKHDWEPTPNELVAVSAF